MTLPLIARLAQAAGPDRELDAAIAFEAHAFDAVLVGYDNYAIVHVRYNSVDDDAEVLVRSRTRNEGGILCSRELPRYTASLDAAMTLRNHDAPWTVHHQPPKPAKAWTGAGDDIDWSKGATAPIAFCMAALKDRRAPASAVVG